MTQIGLEKFIGSGIVYWCACAIGMRAGRQCGAGGRRDRTSCGMGNNVRFVARGARRVTRAVGGTLRSRAPAHRDRGESDFHAGNAIVTARAVSEQHGLSYNNTLSLIHNQYIKILLSSIVRDGKYESTVNYRTRCDLTNFIYQQ